MLNITLEAILAKLPIAKLTGTITMHIQPLLQLLPDKRLCAVVVQMVLGILGSQTPVPTEIAGSNSRREGKTWVIAKRLYRLIHNRRVSTDSFYQGLYGVGQQVVERENPAYLVVAVDPVNFEKPYAEEIEGVSTVYKATPPGLDDQKMFAKVGQLQQEFIFRACHLNRIVEVYNERLHRWETENLQDLTATIPYQAIFRRLALSRPHRTWLSLRSRTGPRHRRHARPYPRPDAPCLCDGALGGPDCVRH